MVRAQAEAENVYGHGQRVHASYFGVSAVVARLPEEEQVRHRGGAARLRQGISFPGRALYCVLPADGALVAVAPSEDMWDSFPRLRKFDIATINEFNGALARLLSAMCGGVRTARDIASMFAESDTEAISALFRAAEDNVRRRGSDVRGRASGGLFAGFMISEVERGRSIVSLLDEVLSPEANGFAARPLDCLRRVDTEV